MGHLYHGYVSHNQRVNDIHSGRWWPSLLGRAPFNETFQPDGLILVIASQLPSGKHTKNYGKSPFLMGQFTISLAIFNSYVKLPEGMGTSQDSAWDIKTWQDEMTIGLTSSEA